MASRLAARCFQKHTIAIGSEAGGLHDKSGGGLPAREMNAMEKNYRQIIFWLLALTLPFVLYVLWFFISWLVINRIYPITYFPDYLWHGVTYLFCFLPSFIILINTSEAKEDRIRKVIIFFGLHVFLIPLLFLTMITIGCMFGQCL